ncbi:MAG: phenylacetate--CoA ligase [Olsenella sp.]|nr:phenylacetate--CoA ligase [Olsenella sp.]
MADEQDCTTAGGCGEAVDPTRLPHEKLEEMQLEGVRRTLVNCYEHIPFYKRSFDEAGFDPYHLASLDDLANAPFVTKQDLRDAAPYGMLAVPLSDVREVHMSSGTTGVATLGAYTQHDLDFWSDCFARGIRFAGGGANDVVQVAYGYGLFTGGLGAHYGALASGATVIPTSAGNTERQIRILREMGTTILCCTPSYAMHIADTALEMGLDPSRDFHLKAGIHGAEPFSDNFRAELERKLGYKVLDIYGLTETMGPGVACECLEQDGLHLAEDHFFAEIIDPATGKRLPDGEWGELVLTTLDREASPVVRYRTRDITRILPGECPCGCTHKRIDRLHGRTDDMLIIRGVNVFPSQIEDVMKTFDQVSSWYQIEVGTDERSLDVVTLKAEANPDFDFDQTGAIEALQRQISARLKTDLSVGVKVRIVEPKSISRSTGKAKRVIDTRKGIK